MARRLWRMARRPATGGAESAVGAALRHRRGAAPAGRYGEPREVAARAAFLLSDEASFTTGAAYPIDGGAKAR